MNIDEVIKWIYEEGMKGDTEHSIFDPEEKNIIGRAYITNLSMSEQRFPPYIYPLYEISLEGTMYSSSTYLCNLSRNKIRHVHLSIKDKMIPFYIDEMTMRNDYGYRAEYIIVDEFSPPPPPPSTHCRWEIEGHLDGNDFERDFGKPKETEELEEILDRSEILDL